MIENTEPLSKYEALKLKTTSTDIEKLSQEDAEKIIKIMSLINSYETLNLIVLNFLKGQYKLIKEELEKNKSKGSITSEIRGVLANLIIGSADLEIKFKNQSIELESNIAVLASELGLD